MEHRLTPSRGQLDLVAYVSHCFKGHFVRSIGSIGETLTETQALLVEHDIDVTPFSEKQV